MTIEDRLTAALREVADRLPDHDATEVIKPRDLSRTAPRWIRAVAAALVLAVGAGVFALARGRDEPVPVATEAPRPLLSATADDFEVRLDTAGPGCVVVVFPSELDRTASPACLGDETISVGATLLSGTTLVYGIAADADQFTATIEQVTTADLHQAHVDEHAAFLMVVPVLQASGTVEALDADGQVVATASFDHGGPARPPKGTLGDQAMELAFLRDGATWARTFRGEEIRLTDGTIDASDGFPFVLADGHTIVHSVASFDGVFDRVVLTDARDGSQRELPLAGTGLLAMSPDATRIAATRYTDDSGATVELVVLDSTTLAEVASVPLGIEEDVGPIQRAAWHSDSARLLVTTRCCYSADVGTQTDRLWAVDVTGDLATEVQTDGERVIWILADRAAAGSAVPALRLSDGDLIWGTLRTAATSVTFDPCCPLSHELAVSMDSYLDVSARADGDWLVSDGRNLFELDISGTLSLLVEHITHASPSRASDPSTRPERRP